MMLDGMDRHYDGEKFTYKVRCDKHNLKPYEYCEMCMIRSDLASIVTEVRKSTISLLSETHFYIKQLKNAVFKLDDKK